MAFNRIAHIIHAFYCSINTQFEHFFNDTVSVLLFEHCLTEVFRVFWCLYHFGVTRNLLQMIAMAGKSAGKSVIIATNAGGSRGEGRGEGGNSASCLAPY